MNLASSIGPYIGDARAQKLELLGSGVEGHDWTNMLGMLGLLEWDVAISRIVMSIGYTFTAAAFFLYLFMNRLHVP